MSSQNRGLKMKRKDKPKNEKPVSLHPLKFEDALKKLLSELKQLYQWPLENPAFEPFPHGWLCASNKAVFEKHKNKDIKIIIELGSWLGKSAMHLCELFPNACVICIDHWEGSPEIGDEFA